MSADRILRWQVAISEELEEAFKSGDAEAQRRTAEKHAIQSLEAAYAAMREAAGTDKLKLLYAEEIDDILRRIRGGHSGA
ncbi:MAG TPA: hypothetical protein VKP14_05975 [Gaiellaceae bacterium]|nr:hypothetical protein [Gaiellaceae bacterium]